MLSFTKLNSLHNVKTDVVVTTTDLKATRIINATVVTITTRACQTIGEFATRANNMCSLTNEDFLLLADVDVEEAERANNYYN